MDEVSEKKINNVSGSDIDEELDIEECLEDLEGIADEIIASNSDSECEPVHKEVLEERGEYNKSSIEMKEENKAPSQSESHNIVNSELVQSIKKYVQDIVKGRNKTVDTHIVSSSKNTETHVNNLNNSGFDQSSTNKNINHLINNNLDYDVTKDNFNCVNKHNLEDCSDGELISDENMGSRSPGNKYGIIEGTEIISDNSEWENLESGECSSSEEVLNKLCEDDEYLSDATTVTGKDKSQIKKSVQEYYKKSEECFLSFYNEIKCDLIEGTKNNGDCNSFKSKSHSYSDSSIKKLYKVNCDADYNKAKLILREFKRKNSFYKKSHRQSDTGHIDKASGNEVIMGIVKQFDSHINRELCNRVSDNLKDRLARLKRNVRKYEKKARKREYKKSKLLINESGRIHNDNMQSNCRNIDERDSKYIQDKTKRSAEKLEKNILDNKRLSYKNIDGRKLRYSLEKTKINQEKSTRNKNLEFCHNQNDYSSRKHGIAVNVKHNNSNKEKVKGIEKLNSEKKANKKLTILSYLEDCEQSVNNGQRDSKAGTNNLKKQQENLEFGDKKTLSVRGSNKRSRKQTVKKNIDPNYENDELFITYTELIENENKMKTNENKLEQRKEEKGKDAKEVSVFAMTLSSEIGKNSTVIPFLQDETDGSISKVKSKESNQSYQVTYPTRDFGLKTNIHFESRSTSLEKTKHYHDQVHTEPHLLVRSVSTSPLRTSSRSRSNSQTMIIVGKELCLRRSRSRSNSLCRHVAEKGRLRRSRSRSSSVIIEKEKYSKFLRSTPYAYRKRSSRSRSRTIYHKKYRSPSVHYRKRYRSRSRTRRHKRYVIIV